MVSKNNKISWSDELSIDQGIIDADHMFIFGLVDEFVSRGQQFKSVEEAYDLVHQLTEYATIHFRREERLHRKVGLSNADAHEAEHRRLEEGFAEIQRVVISTDLSQLGFVSDMMGSLIQDWLVNHINVFDVPMQQHADQLRKDSKHTPPIEDLTLL